jgi:hypothetical protein
LLQYSFDILIFFYGGLILPWLNLTHWIYNFWIYKLKQVLCLLLKSCHTIDFKISKADATKFFATPAYSKDIQTRKPHELLWFVIKKLVGQWL